LALRIGSIGWDSSRSFGDNLRKHVINAAIGTGVLLIFMAGMFGWEVWKQGTAYAFSAENLQLWGKWVLLLIAMTMALLLVNLLSDWLGRRKR
jgi:H+/Cl- antiporter ClcA